MKNSRSFVLLALAAAVNAQSAPGFPVQVSTNLRVDFTNSSTSIDPAGQLLPRDDVLDSPTVDGPLDASSTLDFMIFMIDSDVTSPQDPNTRVQFLHWYQPNLAGASEVLSDFGSDAENFTSAPLVAYVPPTPPGGDIAHKYTLLLYSQPKGFSIPNAYESFFANPSNLSSRLDFDIAGFASAAGLGDPVAANWFQVQNTTAPASSTSAASGSASSTATSSSTTSGTTATTAGKTTASSSTRRSASSTTGSIEAPATTTVDTTGATVVPSASASISPARGSGAGLVDVRSSMKGLVMCLVFSVAGAGLWLL